MQDVRAEIRSLRGDLSLLYWMTVTILAVVASIWGILITDVILRT